MESRSSSIPRSAPSNGERECQVDFLSYKEIDQLRRFELLRENLQPILKLSESYLTVLDGKGSIAKHSGVPLFISRMEARISESFSIPQPRIVEFAERENDRGVRLSWGDLIREATFEQFEIGNGDTCRCRIRGILVEMTKDDRDTLCSPFLGKLFQFQPDHEDVQKERDIRSEVTADLTRLNEDALQVIMNSQKILQLLGDLGNNPQVEEGSTTPAASETLYVRQCSHSAASPVELDGTIHSNTNPTTHIEVAEDDGVESILMVQDQERSPTQSLRLSEKATNSPLKKINAMRSTRRPRCRWSPSEKEKLADFLRGREHLSWQQLADEFGRISKKRRTAGSIKGQAFQMGIYMQHSKIKRARLNQHDPLVLKVRFPPSNDGGSKSTEMSDPDGIVPSNRSPEEQTNRLNGEILCPVEGNSSISRSIRSSRAPSNTHRTANVRQVQDRNLGHESAGPLAWILN